MLASLGDTLIQPACCPRATPASPGALQSWQEGRKPTQAPGLLWEKGLQAARLEVEGPSPSGVDRSMVQGGESRLGAENGIIVSPVLILGQGPGAGTPDPQGVQETKTTSA